MIHIIRGLCAGNYFGYKGAFYNLEPVKLCPVPSEPVELLAGGHSEPALRRAAALGDGWISAGGDLAKQTALIGKVNNYRKVFRRGHLHFDFQHMGPEGYSVDGVRLWNTSA
jgi:alkanesulfonate monooxygenase SsuD/methylene tetrahydromethanopterin reductase-like flavin-dependent oxidoreductase (luciferase family)